MKNLIVMFDLKAQGGFWGLTSLSNHKTILHSNAIKSLCFCEPQLPVLSPQSAIVQISKMDHPH